MAPSCRLPNHFLEEKRERALEATLNDVNAFDGGAVGGSVGMSGHVMDQIDIGMSMLSLEPGCGVINLHDVDVDGCLTFKEVSEWVGE
jgi:hypothetical protein